MRRLGIAATLLVLSLLLPSAPRAQASLAGVVKDTSGGVLPGGGEVPGEVTGIAAVEASAGEGPEPDEESGAAKHRAREHPGKAAQSPEADAAAKDAVQIVLRKSGDGGVALGIHSDGIAPVETAAANIGGVRQRRTISSEPAGECRIRPGRPR